MHEELDQHIANLRDPSKGWVYRRDAADYLGKTVEKAVAALREVASDKDVDVRTAAEHALGLASAVLAGIKPTDDKRSYTLRELAQGCAKSGRREVAEEANAFVVTTHLKDGRGQRVLLQDITRKDGARLIQILTYCGDANESAMPWALKINTQLGRCALGIAVLDGNDRFVLVNCIPAADATPEMVKTVVKEIAFYGDWIERKLTDLDEF